jgi:hypothetical protein
MTNTLPLAAGHPAVRHDYGPAFRRREVTTKQHIARNQQGELLTHSLLAAKRNVQRAATRTNASL